MKQLYRIVIDTPEGETLDAQAIAFTHKESATRERKAIESDHPECTYRVVGITRTEATKRDFSIYGID